MTEFETDMAVENGGFVTEYAETKGVFETEITIE
jgi:hypothetical protein